MSLFIKNITTGGGAVTVTLGDLGLEIPSGDTYDLANEAAEEVFRSTDLVDAIQAGEIAVLDPLDDVTELSGAESEVVIKVHNDAHYRIKGGELDQLDDVDIPTTPDDEAQLRYNDSTGKWEAQDPADATPFGQMFEIVFSEESSVSDAWIASNGTPSNEAPPVVGWDCRLAGITFTNKEVNADTVLQIWRVAEGAAPGTATLVESWAITNARTARKTDYGLTEVTFTEGDKIAIYFVQAGDTDPSGVTVICHFIITDFTGAEVEDNWSGDI